MLSALEPPLARAICLSVLISEVHPFRDGNGRMARMMMNAELVSAHQRRILIPISYRQDYILALRAFSRRGESSPIIQMFARAQSFAAEIDFSDLDSARRILRRCDAFGDPETARLRMPSKVRLANRDPDTGRANASAAGTP